MNFNGKKYYILFVLIFFSWVNIIHANVVIKEVNLDPVGERFIKLYNNSDSSQDLTKWSIKRKSSGGIEYPLLASSRLEGKIIEGNSYFFIVNENTYTGDIIPDATWAKSYTFSDNNTVLLYDQNNKLIDNFIVSKNTSNTDDTSDDSSDADTASSSNYSDNTNTTSSKKEEPEIFKITTKIISPKVVVAGIPFTLDSLTTTNRGITYMVGKFIWNFGDGNNIQVNRAEPFEYTYDYEGEYVLSLSYFDNSFTSIPDSSNKIIIKVIPSDIYISSVGSYTDPYIELDNKSSYDMDISNWIINGVNRSFTIPKGTIISKGNKIKLSPKITGFNGEDIKYVNITNPDREVVATYPTEKKKVIRNISTSNNSSYKEIPKVNSVLENNTDKIEDSNIINLNDLGASASDSKVNISNSTFSIIGLFVVIGIGLTSFLLIKRKKNIGDYVDREVRAEDINIIE